MLYKVVWWYFFHNFHVKLPEVTILPRTPPKDMFFTPLTTANRTYLSKRNLNRPRSMSTSSGPPGELFPRARVDLYLPQKILRTPVDRKTPLKAPSLGSGFECQLKSTANHFAR